MLTIDQNVSLFRCLPEAKRRELVNQPKRIHTETAQAQFPALRFFHEGRRWPPFNFLNRFDKKHWSCFLFVLWEHHFLKETLLFLTFSCWWSIMSFFAFAYRWSKISISKLFLLDTWESLKEHFERLRDCLRCGWRK